MMNANHTRGAVARRLGLAAGIFLLALAPAASLVLAQARDSFDEEPINYTQRRRDWRLADA